MTRPRWAGQHGIWDVINERGGCKAHSPQCLSHLIPSHPLPTPSPSYLAVSGLQPTVMLADSPQILEHSGAALEPL